MLQHTGHNAILICIKFGHSSTEYKLKTQTHTHTHTKHKYCNIIQLKVERTYFPIQCAT